MFRSLLRNRKGISMAEAVVALALLMIVSTAAFTLMISSGRADTVHRDRYRAIAACESAEECVLFAQGDVALLEDALGRVGFVKASDREFVLVCGDDRVTVALEGECYVVRYNGEKIYEDITVSS